jgi:hypothetical protein
MDVGPVQPFKQPDAQYWRDRAEAALRARTKMTSAEARRLMLEVATSYRMLADHAEGIAERRTREPA